MTDEESASTGTTNTWLRLPYSNCVQCLKNRCVKTEAFTRDLERSSSRCLLHASSLQSGQTDDVKRMLWPSGVQISPSASVEMSVTLRGSPIRMPRLLSKSATYT